MTIGPDIKEAIQEVGATFHVLRDGGNLSGEWLDISPNAQVTKPFIREYFQEAAFYYDTLAIPGDVIVLDETSDPFVIMNLTPTLFENTTIENAGVLYKCNKSGELWRPSGETVSSGETDSTGKARELRGC